MKCLKGLILGDSFLSFRVNDYILHFCKKQPSEEDSVFIKRVLKLLLLLIADLIYHKIDKFVQVVQCTEIRSINIRESHWELWKCLFIFSKSYVLTNILLLLSSIGKSNCTWDHRCFKCLKIKIFTMKAYKLNLNDRNEI